MLRPLRGSRNQHLVLCSGTLEVDDIAVGEDTGVVRVEYGTAYETLGGDAGTVEAGVELAIWTAPVTAPVDGFSVVLEAQDETGFWARATKLDDGYSTGDLVLAWEVRGILA